MSFRDLEEFLDPTLKLPIRGKTYVVESPDARTGLWVQGIMTAAAQLRAGVEPSSGDLESLVLDDDEEHDVMKRVLGRAFDEMAANRVPWDYVKHAGQTVMLWVVHGKESAERFWNGGTDPKAPKRKRRKGGGKKARPDSAGSSKPPATTEASTSAGATSSPTGD